MPSLARCCNVQSHVCRLLVLLSLLAAACALPPVPTRRGVLLWQVLLREDQCGGPQWRPCYNVYAVNQSHGDLVWFAFTTDSAAIKGMFLGHHSMYYTTWGGPGLYGVNAATGHVRWQFPLDNWFRYWVKDIDLDRSASFTYSAEVHNVVYVTAAGPPARLYGLRTKSGARQWEFKLPNSSALLADLTGPLDGRLRGGPWGDGASSRTSSATAGSSSIGSTGSAAPSGSIASASTGHAGSSVSASSVSASGGASGPVYLALTSPATNSSWLQALDTAGGSPQWQSEVLQGGLIDRLELQDGRLLATAAAAAGGDTPDALAGDVPPSPPVMLAAWDTRDGSLLWRREGPYCATPSPVATVYEGGRLLFSEACSNLTGLTALDAATGQELWRGWHAPHAARPTGKCSAFAVGGGSVFFGCGCDLKARSRYWHNSSTGGIAEAAGPSSSAAQGTGGVCLYALHSRSGKLRWALPVPGNATFPDAAQAWDWAPLLHDSLAIFLTAGGALAVDAMSGKLRWEVQLPAGEALQAYQQAAVDLDTNVLLLSALVLPPPPAARGAASGRDSGSGGSTGHGRAGGGSSSKTGLSAVSLRDGRLLWHRTVNGSAQPPVAGPGAGAGAAPLTLAAGCVLVEACRGTRCCLRALNVTTGRQRWGMCLDALQGDAATHPHARFAIWLITLLTVASIALLILGACLVYVQRWSEERRILYGTAMVNSPRHSYQPLPARQDDSDEGE